MTRRPGQARTAALVPGRVISGLAAASSALARLTIAVLASLVGTGLVAAGVVQAACIVLLSSPDGARLAALPLPAEAPTFTVTYVHSVTRTPVEERYRVEGAALVETEMRFEQHGPGLPTEPDAGERWYRSDGRYVVTMNRRFQRVVMRIDAATRPQVVAAGRALDLARWGNRALVLEAVAQPCTAP